MEIVGPNPEECVIKGIDLNHTCAPGEAIRKPNHSTKKLERVYDSLSQLLEKQLVVLSSMLL